MVCMHRISGLRLPGSLPGCWRKRTCHTIHPIKSCPSLRVKCLHSLVTCNSPCCIARSWWPSVAVQNTESLRMMPGLRLCATETHLLSKVWLNGPGVAETVLRVQTVHHVRGHTESPCFAYDVPGLSKSASPLSSPAAFSRCLFSAPYSVTSTQLLQNGNYLPHIAYLKRFQQSGLVRPLLVLPPEVPFKLFRTNCRDHGSSPWTPWSPWLPGCPILESTWLPHQCSSLALLWHHQ